MTLNHLQANMTYAELQIWAAYFGLMNDQQQEAMEKGQRRRR